MEVRLFPNSARPGVGQSRGEKGQRPLLPQHARHCPVLESGQRMGFLVFPPLEPYESYYNGYEGDGRYQFIYYLAPPGKSPQAMFTITNRDAIGSIGAMRETSSSITRTCPSIASSALLMLRQLIVPQDLGTPPARWRCARRRFPDAAGWTRVYTTRLHT